MDFRELYLLHACDSGKLEDLAHFLWRAPLEVLWDSRLEEVDPTPTIIRDSGGSFCPVLPLQHHDFSQELNLLEGRRAGLGDGGDGRDYTGCSVGHFGLLLLGLWQIGSTILAQLLVTNWVLVEGTCQGVLLAGLPIRLKVALLVVGLVPNLGCTAKADARRQFVLLLPQLWQEGTVVYFVELQIRITAEGTLGFLNRQWSLRWWPRKGWRGIRRRRTSWRRRWTDRGRP